MTRKQAIPTDKQTLNQMVRVFNAYEVFYVESERLWNMGYSFPEEEEGGFKERLRRAHQTLRLWRKRLEDLVES